MEQKRVSFRVAKAIKEAGYPQNGYEPFFVERDYNSFRTGVLYEPCNTTISSEIPFITAPTYLDVWLWLWREKKINIDISKAWNTEVRSWVGEGRDARMFTRHDPEEVIITAIEYLVENNLL